jgi:hypothetical protein
LKTRNYYAIAAAALALGAGMAVQANQIPGVLLTGTLTAQPAGDYINVDGHSYHIKSGSPAANDARGMAQGQRVDVRLSGPPNTAASEVIGITAHVK